MSSTQTEVPGVTRDRGRGGLERIIINTDMAQVEIYLHGAHVTHFQPRGQAHPVLWLSKSSLFQIDKPIRGGVPICFPWFGPKSEDSKAPAHGFARLLDWEVESIQEGESGAVIIALQLRSNDATKKRWPAEFAAHYSVSVGHNLLLQFSVQNLGREPIRFEEALHSYFTVGDIRRTEVRGLEGAAYWDRLKPGQRITQDDRPIAFAAETDRTYINTENDVTIIDPVLHRKIVNRKGCSRSTVVWNPWIDKAKAMADFGNDEWPGMLCIETANAADNAIMLAPGATYTVSAEIAVE